MDVMRSFTKALFAAALAVPLLFATPRGAAADAVGVSSQSDTSRPASADTSRAAAPDTLRAGRPDTTGAAQADTVFAPPRGGVWAMDELKGILGAENVGIEGSVYRQRRNGRVAMICSLAFPGLGQMYNEKPLKAAIAMGAETFYVLMISQNRRYWNREKQIRDRYPVNSTEWRFHDAWVQEYYDRSVDWIWWSAGTLLVIILDAYVDAHLDDMRFEVAPRASGEGVGLEFVMRY